ncbi:hypothetical protein [Sneathiella chinensis]|uniref:Uncharacterized protein n=1 Tax=Sneathiella chinensis TaxID=349750 RepID=A0ABQ5U0P9_9PROT|nr:hypothetical protein [Sneathiella chinensis]GLQ05734.1 hypothetical protein GCM10007924_09550 [Sneathiella chinensis]
MKHGIIVAGIVALMAVSTPVHAQSEDKGADELAVEGLTKLMDALKLFVDAIPQYAAPEILENGDIIIRRKNKEMEEKEPESDKPDLEKTAT